MAEHKAPFWLVSCTALSALRHNGIAPWQNHVDVSMMVGHTSTLNDPAVIKALLDLECEVRRAPWGFRIGYSKGEMLPVTTTTVIRYRTPHIDVHLCASMPKGLIHTRDVSVPMTSRELFPFAVCRFGLGVAKVPNQVVNIVAREFGRDWETEVCVGSLCGRAVGHLAVRPLWLPT